ncbi:SGNH/GDSL hydrolase family protein [Pseudomonas urmiensis]|uniref:SGNH/GDSL hydrolase family protein n=1 Tax=Pseudomonas urmiensis TaxID=2745493 RepID=UPI003D13EEF4
MIRPLLLLVAALSGGAFASDQSQLDSHVKCPPFFGGAYRVLFIGDSITRHGVNQRTKDHLGWDHVSGMAASAPGKDYPSLLAEKISRSVNKPVVSCYHTYGGAGTVAGRLFSLGQVSATRPDLVVIQLGEHEKEEDGPKKLSRLYLELLRAVKAMPGHPAVIAVGPWAVIDRTPTGEYAGWAGTVDLSMMRMARLEGVPYATVRDLAAIPEARGWGTSLGVKWHPNDLGHALYAERIYTLFEAISPIKPTK